MKYSLLILAIIGLSGTALGQSCDIDGIYHSNFQDIQELLDLNDCNSCHSQEVNSGGWNYETYDAFLRNGDCNEKMILHGDASNSFFYRKLSGVNQCGDNETNAHVLSEDHIDQIESWINFGAPENCVALYTDVRELLDNNGCNTCHGGSPQSWRYDTYNSMFESNLDDNCSDQAVIIKGNSDASFLYDKINNDGFVSCGEQMDSDFGPMSKEDISMVRDWINSGAYETAASLPVILNYFNVRNSGNVVELEWSTEIEIATDKFIIERSPNGRNFLPIAEVKSEGSSSLGQSYNIIDSDPLIGDNFYRLKILDLDNSYNYSNIKRVKVKNGETIISVYPNPAVSQERITVRWLPQADEESTYLNIVDKNGQNLHRKIIFEGTNYVRLPYLLDGVYYIIIEDIFGDTILERVVIIN